MKKRSLKDLHSDKRGAALVEFLVALMPLMITFSSFVQLQQMATARLVLKHSTVVGARAASVISNKNKNTPEQKQGDNQAAIDQAVQKALGPWAQTMTTTVTIQDDSSCNDPYGMVTVRVQAQYKCQVPFGGRIVCGLGGMHNFNNIKYAMPHEGARYKDGGGASCQ
jgi:Flp pilus assembly protein TadG